MDNDQILQAVLEIDQSEAENKAELFELRAEQMPDDEPGRGTFLAAAAEHWIIRGDLDRAADCVARIAEDDTSLGHHPALPRLNLALAAGDEATRDALLKRLRTEIPQEQLDTTIDAGRVGDLLLHYGEQRLALRWYTLPFLYRDPDEIEGLTDDELRCLSNRYLIRRTLGRPVDRFDQLTREISPEVLTAELQP